MLQAEKKQGDLVRFAGTFLKLGISLLSKRSNIQIPVFIFRQRQIGVWSAEVGSEISAGYRKEYQYGYRVVSTDDGGTLSTNFKTNKQTKFLK